LRKIETCKKNYLEQAQLQNLQQLSQSSADWANIGDNSLVWLPSALTNTPPKTSTPHGSHHTLDKKEVFETDPSAYVSLKMRKI